MFSPAKLLTDTGKGLRVLVIPIYVAQLVEQDGETLRVKSAMLLHTILGTLLKVIKVPARLSNANHRARQLASLRQLLQRGEDLLVSEVAGGTEEDYSIGIRLFHVTTVTCSEARKYPSVRRPFCARVR